MGDLVKADIQDSLWIIQHIQKIADRDKEPDLTREVIEACRNEQAFLFLAGKGFLILKPKVENGIKRVLIWIAWREESLADHYIKEIEYLSSLIDAQELEFWTKRKGFQRLAPKLGFDLHEIKNGFYIWRKAIWEKAVIPQKKQRKKES